MIINYPLNDSSLFLQYHHTRTGPDLILICYKNISQFCLNVKDLKKVLGPAKFLDSSKEIYTWTQQLFDKYSLTTENDSTNDQSNLGRADTSFASTLNEE